MGDEADADWQDGLVEWGQADTDKYFRGKMMQIYQCWCPTDNRVPNEFIEAETSFEARKEYARKYRKQASECVGRRQLTAAERSAH